MVTDVRMSAIDRVAGRRHGLLARHEAHALLGRSRVHRWLRDGRLRLVQPGVYRTAGAPQTWHQQLAAAQLASGGVVSHRSAAELWGLIDPAGHVEVSVRPPRSPRLRPPARVHRIKDLQPELTVLRERLRITDPIRTLVDLGLGADRTVVADSLAIAISSKLLPVEAVETLRWRLSRRGRNGVGVIGAVLDDRALRDRPEGSLLEARFSGLALRHDLPRLAYQHEVWDAGRFVARVDAAVVPLCIAIEVDGFRSHSSPDAFQHDRSRQNRLISLGWLVLRFTWNDVVRRPAEVARVIRETVQVRLDAC